MIDESYFGLKLYKVEVRMSMWEKLLSKTVGVPVKCALGGAVHHFTVNVEPPINLAVILGAPGRLSFNT